MQEVQASTEIKKYKERVKYYADTPAEKNKFFCWELTSILTLREAIWWAFGQGFNIRAAWYEKIDLETGEILENTRVRLQTEMNLYFESRKKSILR